ncbi:hypothetical protein ACFTZI_00610 [Streptomyces decoyicus]|uniref:hypothetical protein n=1 Tax=Streptomyces decoyicus TaxID=249567 RepID=UPI003644F2FC
MGAQVPRLRALADVQAGDHRLDLDALASEDIDGGPQLLQLLGADVGSALLGGEPVMEFVDRAVEPTELLAQLGPTDDEEHGVPFRWWSG